MTTRSNNRVAIATQLVIKTSKIDLSRKRTLICHNL